MLYSITRITVLCCTIFFFFNATASTEIYTLSLHDALPISVSCGPRAGRRADRRARAQSSSTDSRGPRSVWRARDARSEEHTSELQSRGHLVCRLLLEKKKKNTTHTRFLVNKIHQPYEHVCA